MKTLEVTYYRNDGSKVSDTFDNLQYLIDYLEWIKLNSTGNTCIDIETLTINQVKAYELISLV